MGKYFKVKCEECGEEFERSEFQPYMKKCKPCRKGDKKVGVKKEPVTKVVSKTGKDFQNLPEWNIRVNACCFDTMKRSLEKGNSSFGGKVECVCGFQFRKLSPTQVGVGLGRYRLEDGRLVIEQNYKEELAKKKENRKQKAK